MKVSYYNIYVEEDKCIICYNTISDSFALVSKADFVKLRTDLSVLKENSSRVYEALVEKGFIIADEVDEFGLLEQEYNKQVHHSSSYEMTILPTLDCNLRCWYCYEKHKVGSRFQVDVPDKIIKHIEHVFQERSYLDTLSVSLFGGEPLLYFKEELYPLLSKLKEVVEGMGKNANFFFVTNAVCITEEMIPLFNHLNAGFQISIDGCKEKHNQVKFIPKTKEGTFERVMNTIRMLTTQNNNVFITLRINFDDETLPHLCDILPEIEDIERWKISIHLERVWQTSGHAENYNNKLLPQIITKFTNAGFRVSYINLQRRTLSCRSSSYNQIIVSYDGSVYKCTGRDFTESFSDGHLNADGTVAWKQEQLDKRMKICTYDNKYCRVCKFLPQCWGPCNQKLLESDNIQQFCPLKGMEMELDDYIRLRLKNHYMQEQLRKL